MTTRRRARRVVVWLAMVALLATACGDDESAPSTTSVDEATTTTTAVATAQTEDDVAPEFVGDFSLDPAGGVIGSTVTATGSGFDPGADLTITWEDTTATWNVDLVEGKFYGREFVTEDVELATVTTDASGAFAFDFVVPEDFGFTHNVSVKAGDETLNRAAYRTEMEMEISPTSGPVGTPITVNVRGMGYGYLENSWQLTYDNKYTGWVSAVTTDGTATAVIPAVGPPGTHVIQLTHGWSHVPYLNNQQSPRPDRPVFTFEFEVTDEPAVMPPPVEAQTMDPIVGTPPDDDGTPAIWTDLRAAAVGTPLVLSGHNLPAGD